MQNKYQFFQDNRTKHFLNDTEWNIMNSQLSDIKICAYSAGVIVFVDMSHLSLESLARRVIKDHTDA